MGLAYDFDYNRSRPSPAFSTSSIPGQQHRLAFSYSLFAPAEREQRHRQRTSSQSTSICSLSAPTQKQMFDHRALYPPVLGLKAFEPSAFALAADARGWGFLGWRCEDRELGGPDEKV